MRTLLASAALAFVVVACSPPAAEAPAPEAAAPEASAIPPAIEAVVLATMPGLTITSGEADGEEFEVAGTNAQGQEYEFDLMQANGVWRVTEIQRDVPWADVPENVRRVAAASPGAFEPVRVIESTQPVDGAVIYELFSAADQPGAPSREVRFYEGEAAVMPQAH